MALCIYMLLHEVKNYLNFIRGMGIKAWIPGSSKSLPEMSVADQCRSGVLCLNYKGSDVYIQGNNNRATNDEMSTEFVRNLDNGSSKNDKLLDRSNDDHDNITVNNYNLNVINIKLPAAVEKFKRDVGIQCNVSDMADGKLEISKFSTIQSRFKKSVETEVDDIQNKIFLPELTGTQFKRVVKEKLTNEVRVAKWYVSSLPNCVPVKNSNCHLDKKALRLDYTGKLWNELDCKSSPEIKKSGLSPGFVQQLIKQFDVPQNAEQKCLRRRSL
ncbi:uncharacterized protein LOC114120759 isoform X1 [Aphis gossypii]|uniref:Uncharacterized protein n=1 Tax=Aphis gossypii TaxID=80765 RepID=A0A9P0IJ76_APHGO|nr:uncharacterized protein LOC114120759 isoform X1 [Aphis gossypii]CAH1707538.1 unnamed protein product [Aphis gossypii]